MIEDRNHSAIRAFYKCMGFGFLILCIKVSLMDLTPMQILETLFIAFWYNAIWAIGIGLAAMFYDFLKKRNNKTLNHTLCH